MMNGEQIHEHIQISMFEIKNVHLNPKVRYFMLLLCSDLE